MVAGHRVLGPGSKLKAITERLRRKGVQAGEVIISMPSATGRQIREAVAACRDAGLKCKILPGLPSLLFTKALASQVREIALEDLLGREPIVLDKAQIAASLAGRRVLVTGAAGSIGSVLCQQIASFQPAALLMFEQAESELFRVENELRALFPKINIIAVVGDVRDAAGVAAAIHEHRADVVFHAAAYKHVPMMERHALAAVTNNVLGTWNVAQAAARSGVESFVMISSDKAVNPVNIMGATKRAAELLVSSFNQSGGGGTRFVSVRFGNVLGSSGSVAPVFRRQIESGGPVTVTHPEVRRYFMLTGEAVQLVLQASTMGNRGEVFVLDMGELIRIADLAENMIRLAGLTPGEDIEIRYTGLRPGEKLYEEVISEGERIAPTSHDRIKVFLGQPMDPAAARHWVSRVAAAVEARDELAAVRLLREAVPEFEPSEEWKARLAQAETLSGSRQAGVG
jgi:FlaA1/EpsC-like NDP-sugar epimerase